ncbi:MAG: M20/M25/M40 family metallo-hydrolase [Mojavia pulchra JT2-VF2]|jgi:Zn-dependent M28 family amino/carboxypeptidase|uniref:M20/M25/M40 family metallo-hydrolase n=1 Tax=Mojavia pulchra JT2-VF2 TaxID=287848 RepID=A0A951Q116_9NOST|nr:M20/M25/M40 family metallo-hydrolase [Mojavia pulchra JT2-VF2]
MTTNSWLNAALVAVLVSLPTACVQSTRLNNIVEIPKAEAQESDYAKRSAKGDRTNATYADVQALVNMGPRVAGTPVMEKASSYLIDRYRQAGYVAEVQTFNYEKFVDLGSNLTINGTNIEGKALNGTIPGKLNAPLVAVPNFGRPDDFAKVNVKGAIAIVRRGEIRFSQKASNAAAAGAVGLVVVNNQPGNLNGATLGESAKIPVLGLSGDRGNPLLQQAQNAPVNVSLNVNAQRQVVNGRNVIAHLPGVTQPKLILGGHYDSVPGSPGANDNASGTAVVLAIARNLANTNLARQTWFVAFDGEEDGLHGSRAFVDTAKPEFLSGLKGMLNFDMVGVNNQLLIGGTSSLTAIAKAVDSDIKTLGSYTYGGSDHAPFANKNVPVLFFYRGQDPNYHSPNDKTIDPKLLNETAQVGVGIVKQLLQAK